MLPPTADEDSPPRPLAGRYRDRSGLGSALRSWGPSVLPAALTLIIGGWGLATPAPGPGEQAAVAAAAERPAGQAHPVLLHLWSELAGESALALRVPSLVAVAAGVALVGELGRRLLTPGVGLCAGLFLAVLPQLSRYAQDAGPTAPAFLLSAAATLLLYLALDRPGWGRWTAYGLVVLLTGLISPPALLVLAGHAYAAGSRWRLSGQRALLWWAPVTVLALVPLAPLAWLAARQRDGELAWQPALRWAEVRGVPGALFGAAAAGLLLIGLAFAARWPDRALIRELAALAATPPALLLLAAALTGSTWAPHHALSALPPVALCAATALRGMQLRAVLALALVAATTIPQHRAIRAPSGHAPHSAGSQR